MAYTGSNWPPSGFNCLYCGAIVPFGTSHGCMSGGQQWPSQDALILTELRQIHALLRDVLLKEKTVAADAAQEGEANG